MKGCGQVLEEIDWRAFPVSTMKIRKNVSVFSGQLVTIPTAVSGVYLYSLLIGGRLALGPSASG